MKLKEASCFIKTYGNNSTHGETIFLQAKKTIMPLDIRTHPHPGFPTDMQPQFLSVLTLAKGTSIIIETVFESRYQHAVELIRMGADVAVDGRTAIIKGVDTLKGARVSAKDLRGGAALILAGLAAEGDTVIENATFVKRGYEDFEQQLSSLGADIRLI